MSSKSPSSHVQVNGIGHCVIGRTDTASWFKAAPDRIQNGTGIHFGENHGSWWAHIDVYSNGTKASQIELGQTQLVTIAVGPNPVALCAASSFSSATVVALQRAINSIGFTHDSSGMTLSAGNPGVVGVLFYNPPQDAR